ncbi:hypothetical protein AVEN_188072-1 [Araneus ventricosus]|uniref:Uncharacterized protein n=1 Tax=Araneus ventricosus TaxID=182803 RepID=A0A4Y2IE86_ARAVE|nr:hypothetical protein AVEN_188072-1 [Araneus ventricosus]
MKTVDGDDSDSLNVVCSISLNIVTKIVLWVYGGNSPTRRIMEIEGLLKNMQEKHVAQVTETIPLIQTRNTNIQQSTSNNSNSTFNRAQITGFPALTADETPKSFQSINSFYTLPDGQRRHMESFSAFKCISSPKKDRIF